MCATAVFANTQWFSPGTTVSFHITQTFDPTKSMNNVTDLLIVLKGVKQILIFFWISSKILLHTYILLRLFFKSVVTKGLKSKIKFFQFQISLNLILIRYFVQISLQHNSSQGVIPLFGCCIKHLCGVYTVGSRPLFHCKSSLCNKLCSYRIVAPLYWNLYSITKFIK
jgi:hypothetical protein